MSGRKYLPLGWSDAAIAEVCGVPLAVWLDCRGICSGPPVLFSEALHDAPSQGLHGVVEAVEDDRSGEYLAAALGALQAMPGQARAVFWALRAGDRGRRRGDAVEALLAAGAAVMDGREPEPEPEPLAAASYDPGETEPLRLLPAQDLGGGRVQLSLLG
jgi:hypothetical protein